MVLTIRVLAVCWALLALYMVGVVIPVGWLLGVGTFLGLAVLAACLATDLVLAVVAAAVAGRRPLLAGALLGIAVLWVAGVAAVRLILLDRLTQPGSTAHHAVSGLAPVVGGLILVALVLPLAGALAARVRQEPAGPVSLTGQPG